MKKFKPILFYIAIIASVVWVLATPFVYKAAASSRALPGIGGEAFWLLLLAVFWGIGETVRDEQRRKSENDQ